MKSRLSGYGGVANPRDTTRYRCGFRLAMTQNASISLRRRTYEMGYLGLARRTLRNHAARLRRLYEQQTKAASVGAAGLDQLRTAARNTGQCQPDAVSAKSA